LLACSCSRSKNLAASPAGTTAKGEPYALRLAGGALTFCDAHGGRKLDLGSGKESALPSACPGKAEPNTACRGLSLDVTVRGPLSEPNDIIDLEASSVPLNGRVHDCAAEGKLLAVVTGSAVIVINVARSTTREISPDGGDRVTIGFGWLAWTQGSKVLAARIPASF
jgi:hypothetical protein